MKTLLLLLYSLVQLNFLCAQSLKKDFIMYKPDSIELEQDIYEQLINKRVEIELKQTWNEVDVRNLAKSGSVGFPEDYLQRNFLKLGYKLIWKDSSHKSIEPAKSTYGELSKEVKIYKNGGKSVTAYLKIYGTNGSIISEGEPVEALKKWNKKGE